MAGFNKNGEDMMDDFWSKVKNPKSKRFGI